MSTSTTAAVTPSPVAERASTVYPPLFGGAGLLATPRHLVRREMLATALHFGAVLVPVIAVLLATTVLGPGTLVTIIVATSIWFAAGRRSYRNGRLAPLAPGVGTASIVGVATGLVALSLVSVGLPGLDLGAGRLLLMAAGVLVTTATLEVLAKKFEPSCRFLIVGASGEGLNLLADLARRPDLPFDCIGMVDEGSGHRVGNGLHRGTTAELTEIVLRERPDLIVLADWSTSSEALRHLLEAASADFRVAGLHQFYEHAFGQIPVRCVSPIWFMSLLHLYQRPYSRITKRIFDLAFAVIGLTVVAPLLLVLAVLVRRSGAGPIIFRQVRLGEGGRTYEILKFRTMVAAAEMHGPLWAREDDPRVTRVGSFLRKTRLDELPQLWNVIRGEMSVVGPRPERPEFLDLLRSEVPFWTSRHLVKPGITGWAQVRLGYTSDAAGAIDKLSYDLYYLRHRNLLVDLAIVARTVGFIGRGFVPHYRRRFRIRVDQSLPTEHVPSPQVEEALLATALVSEASRARDAGPPPSF